MILTAIVSTYPPLVLHRKKRSFNEAWDKGAILATRWSSVSRVHIAKIKMFDTFLLKKGAWTKKELGTVTNYMEKDPRPTQNLYLRNPLDQTGSARLYTHSITTSPSERVKSYRRSKR